MLNDLTDGENTLLLAARTGDIELLKKALAGDEEHPAVDINFQHRWNRKNALLEALKFRQYPMAQFLINQGADVNIWDAEGTSPLILATKAQSRPTIQLLLQHGATVDGKDKSGSTATMIAAEMCDVETLKLLAEYGADLKILDIHDRSLLMHALGRYSLNKIDSEQRMKTVQFLIEQGVDVNCSSRQEISPLYESVSCKDVALMRYLIEQGADVNAQTALPGSTVMMCVAEYGCNGMMALLLENGANVRLTTDTGKNVLMCAAEMASVSDVQLLLENGAKEIINNVDVYGRTAFAWSFLERSAVDVLEVLLKNGATIDSHFFSDNKTFLMKAVEWGAMDKIQLLVSNNVKLNVKNFKGETALIQAAKRNQPEVIKYLVESGAHIGIRDNTGRTAYDYLRLTNPALAKELKTLRIKKRKKDIRETVAAKTGAELVEMSKQDVEFVKLLVTTGAVLEAVKKMSYAETRSFYGVGRTQLSKKYLGRIEDIIRDKRQKDS